MFQLNLNQEKLIPLAIVTILLAILSGILVFKLYNLSDSPDKSKNVTRVLTWWGYFDDQSKIREIEVICNTKLQISEYLYIDELYNWAASASYDIYIYTWGDQLYIDNPHFTQKGPRINQVVKDYHSAISEKYHKINIPKDTVYFQHSLQMFVYDKNQIADLDSLSVEDILEFSNVGKVILMDELIQIDWLVKQLKMGTPKENWIDIYQQFKARQAWHVANNSGLHISSFVTEYLDSNLVLGFLDSGELMNPNINWTSVVKAGQPKTFGFGVHPTLSQISSDVLTLKSHNSNDRCVAKEMASRNFLKWMSETSFYFSPFEEHADSLPDPWPQLTQEFYDKADKTLWLDEVVVDDPPSTHAEVIRRILKACQGGTGCEHWTKIAEEDLGLADDT